MSKNVKFTGDFLALHTLVLMSPKSKFWVALNTSRSILKISPRLRIHLAEYKGNLCEI